MDNSDSPIHLRMLLDDGKRLECPAKTHSNMRERHCTFFIISFLAFIIAEYALSLRISIIRNRLASFNTPHYCNRSLLCLNGQNKTIVVLLFASTYR